jgi:hypothetical protein
MGEPVTTAALVSKAGSSIFGGLAGNAQAQAEQKQAKINAYIGRTRALQTDAAAREGMNAELGSMRAAFASAGEPLNLGTAAIMDELRRVRGNERRVAVSNENQNAGDWNRYAAAAGQKAQASLLGGFVGSGQSLFSLWQTRGR